MENLENNNLEEEKVLLAEYKKLQESTVSKEQYQKDIQELKDKNALYLKAITEGAKVDVPEEDKGSLEDKIKELSKFRGTNLEYWEKTTSAIDQLLKRMPEADITKVTGSEGLEELIKVNEGMKQMVKDADGDSDYFRTLYKQRVTESAPKIAAEIEKAGGVANYIANNNNK